MDPAKTRFTWLAASAGSAMLLASGCLFPDYRVTDSVVGGNGGTGAGGEAGAASGGGPVGGDGSSGDAGATAGGIGPGGAAGASGSGGTSSGGQAPGGGGATCDAPCPLVESCSNGSDDDGDSAVDCHDDDCDDAPSCVGTCRAAKTLPCGTSIVGQRTDALGSTDRLGPYSCTTSAYEGSELAFLVEPNPGENVFLELYALDADAALFVTQVTAGAQCRADFACTEMSDASGTSAEVATFVAESGSAYYAIVDAALPASFAITARCSPMAGCQVVDAIEAGGTIDADNAPGSGRTQALSSYSCVGSLHAGPEVAYMFTPEVTGSYRVDLTNLGGNLSLFVVTGACGATCLSPTSVSIEAGTQPESVTFAADAGETYYLVIESFNTATVSFTLSVTQL